MESTEDSAAPENIDDVPNQESINQKDDSPLSKKERIQQFISSSWRGLVCVLTPIIFIFLLLPFPPEKYQYCAYTLVVMAIYWVTECIPLPVTSFLPIIVFPLTGVMSTAITCKCYMNDTILMFLASMALAYAVEQSGLHRRLALGAIITIGYSHYRLLFALSFTTMFISMWITNTAATTMMVPVNFALLKVFEDHNLLSIFETSNIGETVASSMTICYFCASSFSATVGGIGTLVGTATNLVFKGLFEEAFPAAPELMSFPKFATFSIPYMLIMEILIYLYFIYNFFGFLRPNSKEAKQSKLSDEGREVVKTAVEQDWKELGKITFWEVMVCILFVGAMLMFFSRSPQAFYGWGDMISDYFELNNKSFVRDSGAAMLVIFLMILLPRNLGFFKHCTNNEDEVPTTPLPSILDWIIMNDKLPYSFIFLLGGGFALSEAAKKEYSDLNGKLGLLLKSLIVLPNYVIILLIIVFTVFVTNFASNVAVANVVVPIFMQLALEIDVHPMWYNIAAGFSASYCYCLPVGTPGNLVIQSAAKIPTISMIKAGLVPSLMTIIVSWISISFWAPVVWPDLQYSIQNNTWFY